MVHVILDCYKFEHSESLEFNYNANLTFKVQVLT